MIFQTSDVSISNGKIKDSISEYQSLQYMCKLLHVTVAVAKRWKSETVFVIP